MMNHSVDFANLLLRGRFSTNWLCGFDVLIYLHARLHDGMQFKYVLCCISLYLSDTLHELVVAGQSTCLLTRQLRHLFIHMHLCICRYFGFLKQCYFIYMLIC